MTSKYLNSSVLSFRTLYMRTVRTWWYKTTSALGNVALSMFLALKIACIPSVPIAYLPSSPWNVWRWTAPSLLLWSRWWWWWKSANAKFRRLKTLRWDFCTPICMQMSINTTELPAFSLAITVARRLPLNAIATQQLIAHFIKPVLCEWVRIQNNMRIGLAAAAV